MRFAAFFKIYQTLKLKFLKFDKILQTEFCDICKIFASYFVAIVSVQSKHKHRNSRLIVRSSEMFREIQNSDDSVAIFGSRCEQKD